MLFSKINAALSALGVFMLITYQLPAIGDVFRGIFLYQDDDMRDAVDVGGDIGQPLDELPFFLDVLDWRTFNSD